MHRQEVIENMAKSFVMSPSGNKLGETKRKYAEGGAPSGEKWVGKEGAWQMKN